MTGQGKGETPDKPAEAHRRNGSRDRRNENRPAPLSDAVSSQMRGMRRASTGPELSLRRELHRRGLRFRVNYRGLPGTPDIAFTRARLAVFMDGCFWHLCGDHAVMPKNNGAWWAAKLARNVERDREKDRSLQGLGWLPLHVWEHEDVLGAADRVERTWRTRILTIGRGAPPAGSQEGV